MVKTQFMKISIFRPRYSFKNFLDVITLGFLLFFALVFSYLKKGLTPTSIFGWIFLGFFVVFVLHFLIRRITFSQSIFCVERYFWPSKTIGYTDVIDLGKTKIKTRKGEISFAGMSNAPELLAQFTKLIEQGKIKQNQIENKVVLQETIFRKSIIPALVVTFMSWVVVIYFWPFHDSRFSTFGLGLSLVVIFLLVILTTQWIIKKAGYRLTAVSRDDEKTE
jgi:hypothetical protein